MPEITSALEDAGVRPEKAIGVGKMIEHIETRLTILETVMKWHLRLAWATFAAVLALVVRMIAETF